ncbi:MAG: RES family NAD+ phosphorylase [Pseudomonadota bacterium]|nr:RES family NAD+ phosphorylase [Pseudomonadota bacterium]
MNRTADKTDWDAGWAATCQKRIDMPQAWRGVETQYASATLQLVDSHAEHDVLESLLEASKPPLPKPRPREQHFLLTTPFRYTPQHDSRFRPARPGCHGLWYGAEQLRGACAEVAYWRMRFILESAGLVECRIVTRHTFFQALVEGQGIDLMAPPWLAFRHCWTDGSQYTHTHRLSAAAEAAGAALIRYESVRAAGCACVAVFTPDALREPPGGLDATRQAWTCIATREQVLMHADADRAQRFEWRE